MNSKAVDLKLRCVRDFQSKYPTSHVGGSIGLLLRGIDLQRDLTSSDLDVTIDEVEDIEVFKKGEYKERSDFNDFDVAIAQYFDREGYVKIDIRINPEPSFDVLEYEGHKYNVSKQRDILFWKKKYAAKGGDKAHR